MIQGQQCQLFRAQSSNVLPKNAFILPQTTLVSNSFSVEGNKGTLSHVRPGMHTFAIFEHIIYLQYII